MQRDIYLTISHLGGDKGSEILPYEIEVADGAEPSIKGEFKGKTTHPYRRFIVRLPVETRVRLINPDMRLSLETI